MYLNGGKVIMSMADESVMRLHKYGFVALFYEGKYEMTIRSISCCSGLGCFAQGGLALAVSDNIQLVC